MYSLENYDDTYIRNKLNQIPTDTVRTNDERLNKLNHLDKNISDIKEFTEADREKLNSINPPSKEEIADAVWDKEL